MKINKRLYLIPVLLLVVFVLSFFISNDSKAFSETEENDQYKHGEVLIKFKNDDEIYKFKFDSELGLDQVIESYGNNEYVEVVEPNFIYQLSLTPNDAKYFQEWHLEQVQAPTAWEITTGSNQVTIAIIDSGVDINHPDIKNNVWVNRDEIPDDNIDNDNNGYIDDINGWDFLDDVPDPTPKLDYPLEDLDKNRGGLNHGTVIAGIIAAEGNNEEGIAGVSWDSNIMSLRMLDSLGYGDLEDLIETIKYAIDKKVDVINFSFVGYQHSELLDEVLLDAYNKGIVIVAAAGNELLNGDPLDLDEQLIYPVCSNYNLAENVIIGVGATDTLDQMASFSGFGTRCLDINAPGYSIYSTQLYKPEWGLNDYYGGRWSGTSLSSPIVSGAAALIKSINKEFTSKEITDFLLEGADSIDDINPDRKGHLGFGRLNIGNSMELALGRKVYEKGYKRIITTPIFDGKSKLVIYDLDFNELISFNAYPFSFEGGVNLAVSDFGNDDYFEIITAPGKGGGPQILIFSETGDLKGQFFAYAETFKGGVSVAVGDVNGDGEEEIITGPGEGIRPEIKIFDKHGQLLDSFFPFDEGFIGGVNLAAGDITGDKTDEIIIGVGKGNPNVAVYSGKGELKTSFFAYASVYTKGVLVETADINNDGVEEIVAGTNDGGGPHVRIFDAFGNLKLQFFSGDSDFRGGVFVEGGDIDGDGQDEIITGSGIGKDHVVNFYDERGESIYEFLGFQDIQKNGLRVRLMK